MAENLGTIALRVKPSTMANYERFAVAIDAKPTQVMRAILEAAEPYIVRTTLRVETLKATGRFTPLSMGVFVASLITDLATMRRASKFMDDELVEVGADAAAVG
jgi:hypothetical protein